MCVCVRAVRRTESPMMTPWNKSGFERQKWQPMFRNVPDGLLATFFFSCLLNSHFLTSFFITPLPWCALEQQQLFFSASFWFKATKKILTICIRSVAVVIFNFFNLYHCSCLAVFLLPEKKRHSSISLSYSPDQSAPSTIFTRTLYTHVTDSNLISYLFHHRCLIDHSMS